MKKFSLLIFAAINDPTEECSSDVCHEQCAKSEKPAWTNKRGSSKKSANGAVATASAISTVILSLLAVALVVAVVTGAS